MFSNDPGPAREGAGNLIPSQRDRLDMGLGPNERRHSFPPFSGLTSPVSLIWVHDASYLLFLSTVGQLREIRHCV